jgi:hypothetical protein
MYVLFEMYLFTLNEPDLEIPVKRYSRKFTLLEEVDKFLGQTIDWKEVDGKFEGLTEEKKYVLVKEK